VEHRSRNNWRRIGRKLKGWGRYQGGGYGERTFLSQNETGEQRSES
jgi:hypothetical protein